MSRQDDTPADHWRGVRGPVIIAVALLVLGGGALLVGGSVGRHRLAADRQAVEAERARQDAGAARRAIRAVPPGRE